MRSEAVGNIGIVFLSPATLRSKHRRLESRFARKSQSGRLGNIRNDDSNLDALEPAFVYGICNRLEIRTAPREQDSQSQRTAPWIRRPWTHVYCTRRSPLTTRPIT